MKAANVVNALCARIPFNQSWCREAWGPYNVDPEATVERVLFCVTPTLEVKDHFHKEGYDLLVSHHPFQCGVPQVILHTAMDCCPGGLNDQWRDALGVKNARHFDRNLGWYGQIEPKSVEELSAQCSKFMGGDPIGVIYTEVEQINSVVICSGLGGMVHNKAYNNTHADCYIVGEMTTDPLASRFPAMIETGHTLSEYAPGLKLIRSILEPHVPVDGAGFEIDRFADEVYTKGSNKWVIE